MKTILILTIVFLILFARHISAMNWTDWGSGLLAGLLLSYWIAYFMLGRWHDE